MEDGHAEEETIGESFLNTEQHDCRQEVFCISTSLAKWISPRATQGLSDAPLTASNEPLLFTYIMCV